MLTPAQIADWERDGFLVLPDFVPLDRVADLRDRAAELVEGFDADAHRTTFTTGDDQTRDQYFLDSGPGIGFFYEVDAVDADGHLTCPKDRAINKFGHAMHDLDPVFDRFSRAPEVAELVGDLGAVDPLLLQSMYIFKQPHIGGEVPLHQDVPFLWTEPMTTLGLWFALEDATVDNGCLWAVPGGHRWAPRRRFHRDGAGGTTFDVFDPEPFPTDGEVPLPVGAGTVIALHGQLPHHSHPNRSPRARHAYTLHVIDAASHYPPDNWLQRPAELPLRGF